MLLKTDGVVLKQTKFGEGDAIVTIFSKKVGKIQGVAKGSRRPKGKYAVGTQPFAYGEFILFKGRDLYQISQIDIKESFYKLRENVIDLSYASYILELTESVIFEGQTNNRLFNTLLKVLFIFSKVEHDNETLTKGYELKLLDYSGYKPELDRCVHCSSLSNENYKFSSKEGGLLCNKCFGMDPYAMYISNTTINVIKYLIHTEVDEIAPLKIKPNVLKELNKIIKNYISTHVDKNNFKSLMFLETIKGYK